MQRGSPDWSQLSLSYEIAGGLLKEPPAFEIAAPSGNIRYGRAAARSDAGLAVEAKRL